LCGVLSARLFNSEWLQAIHPSTQLNLT